MTRKDYEREQCAYCGKKRPSNEMESRTIIYRIQGAIVANKRQRYCMETNCGLHDQIAHLPSKMPPLRT